MYTLLLSIQVASASVPAYMGVIGSLLFARLNKPCMHAAQCCLLHFDYLFF